MRHIAARLGQPPPRIAPDVQADLRAYTWPGNVRELRNVIERALILNPGPDLVSLDLPPVAGLASTATASGPPGADASSGEHELNIRAVVARHERESIVEALRRSRGVRKEAARLLGIDQRNLAYYLRKHGIDPDAAG